MFNWSNETNRGYWDARRGNNLDDEPSSDYQKGVNAYNEEVEEEEIRQEKIKDAQEQEKLDKAEHDYQRWLDKEYDSNDSSDYVPTPIQATSRSSTGADGWGALIVLIIIGLVIYGVFNGVIRIPSFSTASPSTNPVSGIIEVGTTPEGYRQNAIIRQGAGRNTPELVRVITGTQLRLIAETTGSDGYIWYQVSYNSIQGYIRSDLVIRR